MLWGALYVDLLKLTMSRMALASCSCSVAAALSRSRSLPLLLPLPVTGISLHRNSMLSRLLNLLPVCVCVCE